MDIEDLIVYRRSLELAEEIWTEVETWPRFAQQTVGRQLVRSADSVSANISEGHGRYHYGEKKQFCYYSRGSIQETMTWLDKAQRRNLISDSRAAELKSESIEIRRMLNGYIRSLGRTVG